MSNFFDYFIFDSEVRMYDNVVLKNMGAMLGGLADVNRLRLLLVLSESSDTVTNLAQRVGISQPLASYHLQTLRDLGLVEVLRDGVYVEYRLIRSKEIMKLLSLTNGLTKEKGWWSRLVG